MINHWSTRKGFEYLHQDSLAYLQGLTLKEDQNNTFIYCDPPYPLDTIRSNNPLYQHTLTNRQHLQLLRLLKKLTCNVMISTYENPLYSQHLKDWRCLDFQVRTRQGVATERLYMNYDEPVELHQYDYLGNDHRNRARIKAKAQRWLRNFHKLPALERQAIFQEMQKIVQQDL